MTQDIYQVITQDLLEHTILQSILEPLPLSDLIAQTLITPLGVLLHEDLEELEVYWTPNYLPCYIDGVYTTTTSSTAKQLFLPRDLHSLEQDIPDENWNTPYLPEETKYTYEIPAN